VTRKENPVLDKSFDIAMRVLDVVNELNEIKQFVVAKQVCRSGTSIAANIREAQRAESKADFIHKLSIALKEAEETDYWFSLIDRKILRINKELIGELNELIRLLVSIISSTKRNLNRLAV
jgi:four helix bundle protein